MTFDQAVDLYTEWAGNDAVTMTWSNSDLYVLLDNFKLRRNLGSVPFIGMYADLQKYAQSEMIATGHTITSQISVANAALSLSIPIDGIGLHRALDDSLLCAEILRKVFNKKRFNNFVTDTKASDFYDRLTFKAYIIKDIESPLINRQKLEFVCDKCKSNATRLTPWVFKGQSFRAEFCCRKCSYRFMGLCRSKNTTTASLSKEHDAYCYRYGKDRQDKGINNNNHPFVRIVFTGDIFMSFLTFYCAVLLTLCGVLFTVKSGFYVFKRPGDIVKCTVGKLVKEKPGRF